MQFEVFDRTTERKIVAKPMRMTINLENKNRMRFNRAACEGLGMQPELYLKFLRFGKQWFACVTNEGTGYAIILEDKTRAGAAVHASLVIRQILTDMKVKGPQAEFYVVESENEYQESRLFELLPIITKA